MAAYCTRKIQQKHQKRHFKASFLSVNSNLSVYFMSWCRKYLRFNLLEVRKTHGSCFTRIHKMTRLQENALSGLQCKCKCVTSLSSSIICCQNIDCQNIDGTCCHHAQRKDFYSPKGPAHPEFRRSQKRRPLTVLRILFPQSEAPSERNALWLLAMHFGCYGLLSYKSRFCIDILDILR